MGGPWWSREYVVRFSVRRCVRACAVLALGGAIGLVSLYLARAPILGWVGRSLVTEDPVQPANAIVVLVGGTPGREIEGASLYAAGLAPRVVLPRTPESPGVSALLDRHIVVERPDDLRQRILRELGVPDQAIVRLPTRIDSTFEEADAVVAWASREHVRSLLVVTSRFHTKRVRLTYDRAVAGRGIVVRIHAVDIGEAFRPDDWWRSRAGLRTGLFEIQKLTMYRLMY